MTELDRNILLFNKYLDERTRVSCLRWVLSLVAINDFCFDIELSNLIAQTLRDSA